MYTESTDSIIGDAHGIFFLKKYSHLKDSKGLQVCFMQFCKEILVTHFFKDIQVTKSFVNASKYILNILFFFT